MKSSVLSLLLIPLILPAADLPPTGPATEKRFQPLTLPAGFKATLFACDPFIEYPSVIAVGPKNGSLFVGIDYMTGLGADGIVKSEIRLIEDTDGDGYADKSTVYAKSFNSIQGLAYYHGDLYVMHSPYLTRLRDTKKTGVADERKDLLTGLGLPPEENPVRLHCANGVVVGHDGWLYLALGDHGCDLKRPEGDRLALHGGGILRCRPDGSDLHIFATGTRNVYDISLDEDLNVFFRDNENDGGTYMIRVCHSFFGADHGYPYLYEDRKDEALRPLADLGLGSSAGGVCYLETQFPPRYRRNLFNCEWGRSVVRSPLQRQGSGFAPVKEIEFAAGAENDPYGFKPTDLVVDRDGALLVSDWADGQRPKRGRGRIYRIVYADDKEAAPKEAMIPLDSESLYTRIEAQRLMEECRLPAVYEALRNRRLGIRGRLHAIWIVAHGGGSGAIDELFEVAKTDPDPRVQAQAVRALADLVDPVLVKHRLDAGAGDPKWAARLAGLAPGREDPVLLEIVVALGRLRWAEAPNWLQKHLTKSDATFAHAAMMTLRKCDNWPAVLKLMDLPTNEPIRAIALHSIAEQYAPDIVDGLIARMGAEKDRSRRFEYADALTRVYKKPGPWVYWGYRPPPRPANSVEWERTTAIADALDRALTDADKNIRLAILRRMQREKLPVKTATLLPWLREETAPAPLAAILDTLRDAPADAVRPHLEEAIADKRKPAGVRMTALSLLVNGLEANSEDHLLALAKSIDDGPVLAEAIRQLAKHPKVASAEFIMTKAMSDNALVRAAAIDAIGDLKLEGSADRVRQLLADPDAHVRRAAALSVGKLGLRPAIDELLKLAKDPDAGVRQASLTTLRVFKESRAIQPALLALANPETQQAALLVIAELGGPKHAGALADLARQNPSAEVLPVVLQAIATWSTQPKANGAQLQQSAAELQGASGVLALWRAGRPAKAEVADLERWSIVPAKKDSAPNWPMLIGAGPEARLGFGPVQEATDGLEWIAYTDLSVPEKIDVQFLAGASAGFRVWLNGKLIYKRDEAAPYRIDSERFPATLDKGANRVLLQIADPKAAVNLHLRFRRKSSSADREKLTQVALARTGNAERGGKLFFNAEKTQCIKCHRIGDQGERIGPELTGLGNRFSRIHIVESILEPSRTIATGFQGLAVTLNDGRQIVGVKILETETTITLADNQGKKQEVKKADIEAQRTQNLSIMPEGLEKPLTVDEFVDLIAFLVSQKENRGQ